MGALRTTFTAVLMLAMAAAAEGQCTSEARTISTRRSSPNLVAGPSAWGAGVLAVAKFDRAARRIFVTTYDHELDQLSGDVLIATNTPDGPLHLLFNGVDFGLFYRTLGTERLMYQRISTTGSAVGAAVPVSSRTIDITEEIDVAWSDALEAYAIATTYEPRASRDVWITVIDRAGNVLRDLPTNVFTTQDVANLNVAVTSDGVIGVFYRGEVDESILFARVAPNIAGAPVDQIWTRGFDLKVTALGDRFHLLETVENLDKTEIRWLVLDSAGIVAAPDRLLLQGVGLDVRPLSLISSGSELALAYLDSELGFENDPGDVHLRRFTPAGATVSDTLFAAADPVHRFATPRSDIVWTERAYMTTAVFELGRELDSLLVRLCPLRAAISTERVVVTTRDQVTFTAVTEGGVPGQTFVWDLGDRSPARRGQSVTHRFLRNGTYDVTVTVTDESGETTTATIRVFVVELKKRAVRR